MKIKFFRARFDTVMVRFYLTMLVAIVSFMLGYPWIAAICLPICLSALMGVKIEM